MARRYGTSRGRGVGGYLKGVLAGLAFVLLVLVALALIAPAEFAEDGELTAVEGEELEVAEGEELEVAPEATVEPELEMAEPGAEPEVGTGLEVAEDQAAVDTALEDIDQDLGEAPGEDLAIDPVEFPGLPEGSQAANEATEEGGADAIPPEMETILEGAAEQGDAGPAVGLEVAATGDEAEAAIGESAGLPPPLPETRPIELAGPALSVNAADYEAAADQPVIGVMLDGAAGSELTPDVLFALPVPVTLGVVPGREGDQALAAAARARNWEVVAQLPVAGEEGEATPGALAAEMTAEEVSERTEALLGRLSDAAVAAVETARLGDDPAARAAMLEALEEHGFAYVGEGGAGGPASAEAMRRVPAGATVEEVYAALEEAAAEAGTGGAALIVLPSTRAAAEALGRWNAERGAGRIAPLSAVIARQAGG